MDQQENLTNGFCVTGSTSTNVVVNNPLLKDIQQEKKKEASMAIVIASESSQSLIDRSWTVNSLRKLHDAIRVEIVEKVMEGFETILEMYYLYGLKRPESIPHFQEKVEYKRKIKKELIKAGDRMLNYLSKNGEKEWLNYFKYKTLAFYAYYETEKTDLLPAPKGLEGDHPGIILSGHIGQWVKLLRRKNQQLFSSFIVSMNVIKTGLPRPTDDMIEVAEDKCANHLTDVAHLTAPLPEDCILTQLGLYGEQVILSKDSLCQQLRRTVNEMFDDVLWTEDEMYEPFYPSTSSNYNNSRGKAGAVGTFYQKFRISENFLDSDDLVAMDIVKVQVSDKVSEKYGEAGLKESEELRFSRNEQETNGVEFNSIVLRNKWREAYDVIYQKALTESPFVKPVGLAEPCKVRVISKGPPLLYTAMKPFQKFLWRILKTNKIFELIGTPVTTEIIQDLMGEMKDSEIIVNGDYKASTDNLHSWVSETLANALVDKLNENGLQSATEYKYLDENFREMLIRSLTGHIFEMRDGTLKKQTEGQLMGSITSFPFLCLANAAMCRWALELANMTPYRVRNRPLASQKTLLCPLRVNGDDCTMKGERNPMTTRHTEYALKDYWLKITAFGGLSSSAGKTLFSLPHKPICVINSQTYDYDSGIWTNRKLVNSGLLLGKSKSVIAGTVSTKKTYSELGAIHRELKKHTPPEIWTEVSKRFIYYNKDTLMQCPDIPWEAPEYLGGPGLCLEEEEMSYLDRACCSYIILKSNSDNKKEKIKKEKPNIVWRLHETVQKRLKPYDKDLVDSFQSVRRIDMIFDPMSTLEDDYIITESTESNYSKLYKMLTIETLFTKKLKDIYREEEAYNYNVLKHNNVVWANARTSFQTILGFNVRKTEEILYEKKYSYIPTIEVP